MDLDVTLTDAPIAEQILVPLPAGAYGAWIEFRGVVREEESGQKIAALAYEAYPEMARREMRRLLEEISKRHACLAVRVIHRIGLIPVGEAAIYVGVAARHRAEGFALLAEFMDRLKQDVPIWKRGSRAVEPATARDSGPMPVAVGRKLPLFSLDEAMAKIQAACQPLPPLRVPLAEAGGRVLREPAKATEDLPPFDCSTRDGYAILADDPAIRHQVVGVIHAADWQPRQLHPGEAVRVATGAPLPCDGLRVIMQEDAVLEGDFVRLARTDSSKNIRRRGDEVKAGQVLVTENSKLDAGRLALLATAGLAHPLVSPRLRVVHLTTGDEIVRPEETPSPGQIRDSNSILIRGLLAGQICELHQAHLPENFVAAWAQLDFNKIAAADLVLVSGGASVGERDFTRPLLEQLGFEIQFNQVNLRPGRPLIFGIKGAQVAFGLPGNPLSHFVCFHFAVATALARLTGAAPPTFQRGVLPESLVSESCPRETLWPARLSLSAGRVLLHPLNWGSSGDVTCFAQANALIRVPAGQGSFAAGAEVNFLPAGAI